MTRLSASELGLPEVAPCPFCGGSETELLAGFGSQLSVATYWCRRCRSAFETFKAPPGASDPEKSTRSGKIVRGIPSGSALPGDGGSML